MSKNLLYSRILEEEDTDQPASAGTLRYIIKDSVPTSLLKTTSKFELGRTD